MDVYIRFLFDFMSQFFGGIARIFSGLFSGISQIFNFNNYYEVIKGYSTDFGTPQWLLVTISIIIFVVLLGSIVILSVLLFRKYIRFRKSLVEQEALLEEVGTLQKDLYKLTQEKEKLFAMKVSQLGLKPQESSTLSDEELEKKDNENEKTNEKTNEKN